MSVSTHSNKSFQCVVFKVQVIPRSDLTHFTGNFRFLLISKVSRKVSVRNFFYLLILKKQRVNEN
jgi:hypothetical protein